MKKLLLLALVACTPVVAEAAWFRKKPTRAQRVYLKTKSILSHKVTLCALSATIGAVGMREYMRYKTLKGIPSFQ